MIKLKILLLFFICSSTIYAQKEQKNDLFYKYWQYKERFYKNFIRIDWGSDGIGKFEEIETGNPAWYGRYEKAGYSLPASTHHPTRNNYWWPTDPNTPFKQSHCNLNPDLSTENGVLAWSEDTGGYLGLYLAVLASEYALLVQNGEKLQAEKTLEEIYLALQAFRRLNMTANRWVTRYLAVVPDFECKKDWTEDLSGYSGLTIRCDVPYRFWKEFHHPTVSKHVSYGQVNPKGTDEFGAIPLGSSKYRCADLPNGVPDIRNIYSASQLSCQAQPHCGYKVSDCKFLYMAPNDQNKLAPEILAEKYMSQDQTIGLLLGLCFIKRFIPADALHQSPDGAVSILIIATEITKSLASSLGGSGKAFYVPPCLGQPDNYAGKNGCGYDWRFTKYGICKAITYITGEAFCSGNYFNFSTILVQGFVIGKKPLLINIEGSNEKRRMNYCFYHTLVALANPKKVFLQHAMKDAQEYAPWVEPFYPLLRKILHQIPDSLMVNAGHLAGIDYRSYEGLLEKILKSYNCDGNCVPAKKLTDCNVPGYPQSNLSCESGFVHHADERTGNRLAEWYSYGDDFYGNGLDFMLLYNMYRLSFPSDDAPTYRDILSAPNYKSPQLGDGKYLLILREEE